MSELTSVGSQTATALYNAIKDEKASTVFPKLDSVVQIDAAQKPVDAAKLLWKKNLLAVPVHDEDQQKYIGYFDMRDILRAVLQAKQEAPTASDESDHSYDSFFGEDSSEDWFSKSPTDLPMNGFKEEEVTLRSFAERRPIYSCRQDDSLEDLCRLLSQSDCRRVLVCSKKEDGEEECGVDMVSRSTIINYLVSNISHGAVNNETLDEAGIDFRKEVVSVQETATAKEAFELILDKKLYGIAVVDEDGGLVGNTSARDVKLATVYPGSTESFDMDILSFLAGVRQDDSPKTGKKAKFPACNVRESSSLGHVLKLLAKTGYHRVFVTNDYLEPVGVVSEQDILRYLLEKGKLQLSHDLPNVIE
jgi:CBS domain-containing protein